jgi:hypothetical protein
MSFGSYLTLPPLRRALVQLAGMPGSMLGALIAAELFTPALPAIRIVSWVAESSHGSCFAWCWLPISVG